jgi:hypothetical protein
VRLAHGLTAGGEPSIGLTIVSRPDATDEVSTPAAASTCWLTRPPLTLSMINSSTSRWTGSESR